MSRYSPKNVMEAMTYQLEDDIKVLRCLAVIGDRVPFKKQIKVLQTHINCMGKESNDPR